MSSLPPAPRSLLGGLALVCALALTACVGDQPEEAGTAAAPGAPAPSGPSAGTIAGTAPAASADAPDEPVRARPTAEQEPAATPAAAPGDGGPAADADGPGAGGTAGGGTGDGPAACRTAGLEVGAAPAGGGAGSVHTDVTVTNTGQGPCVLAGYPGVSFVDAAGTTIGAPAVRDTAVPGTGQVLAPGESAGAALRIGQAGNHPACEAEPAAGLRVYPPENTESVVVPFPAQACAGAGIHQLEIQGFGD